MWQTLGSSPLVHFCSMFPSESRPTHETVSQTVSPPKCQIPVNGHVQKIAAVVCARVCRKVHLSLNVCCLVFQTTRPVYHTTVSAQTRDVCQNFDVFCMPVSTRYTPPLLSVYKFYLQMYRHYVNQTSQINRKFRRMEHGKLNPVTLLLYRVASPFVPFWLASPFVPFWLASPFVPFWLASPFVMFWLASPFVMFWSKGTLTACTPSRFQLWQRKEAKIGQCAFSPASTIVERTRKQPRAQHKLIHPSGDPSTTSRPQCSRRNREEKQRQSAVREPGSHDAQKEEAASRPPFTAAASPFTA